MSGISLGSNLILGLGRDISQLPPGLNRQIYGLKRLGLTVGFGNIFYLNHKGEEKVE